MRKYLNEEEVNQVLDEIKKGNYENIVYLAEHYETIGYDGTAKEYYLLAYKHRVLPSYKLFDLGKFIGSATELGQYFILKYFDEGYPLNYTDDDFDKYIPYLNYLENSCYASCKYLAAKLYLSKKYNGYLVINPIEKAKDLLEKAYLGLHSFFKDEATNEEIEKNFDTFLNVSLALSEVHLKLSDVNNAIKVLESIDIFDFNNFGFGYSRIGDLYLEDKYLPKSVEKAIEYYEKGFGSGNAKIADLYFYGKEVPQSYETALKYYRIAANYSEAFLALDKKAYCLIELGKEEEALETAYLSKERWGDNYTIAPLIRAYLLLKEYSNDPEVIEDFENCDRYIKSSVLEAYYDFEEWEECNDIVTLQDYERKIVHLACVEAQKFDFRKNVITKALAKDYCEGFIFEKDPQKAIQLFEDAHKNGCSLLSLDLLNIYENDPHNIENQAKINSLKTDIEKHYNQIIENKIRLYGDDWDEDYFEDDEYDDEYDDEDEDEDEDEDDEYEEDDEYDYVSDDVLDDAEVYSEDDFNEDKYNDLMDDYETNMIKIKKYIDENKEEFLDKLKSAKETRNKNLT